MAAAFSFCGNIPVSGAIVLKQHDWRDAGTQTIATLQLAVSALYVLALFLLIP